MATAIAPQKPKTIFQLDTPFTAAPWPPETSKENQTTILELLCSILTPIGQHRLNYTAPSKGKRSQKRKREEARLRAEKPPVAEVPAPPEISSHIVVGLNHITRNLEDLSEKSKPQSTNAQQPQNILDDDVGDSSPAIAKPRQESTLIDAVGGSPRGRHFAAIFAVQTTRSDVLNAHLPQLVATASLARPKSPATRLVQLPRGCDNQVCKALGLQRVSFIGIFEDAPHCAPLLDLIREAIPEVEVPWLLQAKHSVYLPVKINAIETFISNPKKESKKV